MLTRLALWSLLALTSCGTVFNGGTSVVSFGTEPPGAQVVVDGTPMGTTPCQLSLSAKKEHHVEFRLEGFAPGSTVVTSSLEAVWLVLDIIPGVLLGGIIPVVVDAITESWKDLDQASVHVVLSPLQPRP